MSLNPNCFPGGVPHQRTEELVEQVRSLGWDQAWWDFSQALNAKEWADLEQALGVEVSESWQNLVELDPAAVALDYGCGWGPLSLSLAEKVSQVYTLDPCPTRLQLLRARAEQRGLHNLHYLQAEPALSLPFPDHFFDLVNLGGILEHIPCFQPGNPRRVQRQFLREIRRILKPLGLVFAGVQNRFALKYFYGKPQDGLGLPYVTLMPRYLAHLYCLLTRGRTYRNYTHTGGGIRRLFRQAGFASVQTLGLSHHAKFDQVIDPDKTTILASLFPSHSRWKGLGKRILLRAGVLPWLIPSFGVVASPAPHRGCFLAQIVDQVGSDRQTPYRIVKILTRDFGGCVLILQEEKKPDRGAVLKLAFLDGSDKLLERTARNAALMAGTLPRPELVPRILQRGSFKGHAYVLEERLRGANGLQLIDHGWSGDGLADTVWDFLEAWMRTTRSTVRMSPGEFADWVPYRQEPWQRLAGPRTAQGLEELVPRLSDYMVGRERIMVASHGDLWLGNILFDENTGDMRGLLDWDTADLHGLPLVDALTLSQSPDIARQGGAVPFDAGFPDQFAESHTVDSLAETLRCVSDCAHHPRLARIRSENGYETDQDARMALLLIFLKRHQPNNLVGRKQTRKWVEAFRLLLADH